MSEPHTPIPHAADDAERPDELETQHLVPPAVWEPLEPTAPERPARRALAWVAGLAGLIVLVGIIVVAWQCQLLPDTGTVARLERGMLQVRDSQDGPWFTAGNERMLRQAARLRAGNDAVAWLAFEDGTQMRIESAGEWRLATLQRSRNRRISRLTIEHADGQASYVAPLPNRWQDARLSVWIEGATLELTGVATVTLSEGVAVISILDGHAALEVFQRRLPLLKGERIRLDAAQRQVIRE
jgi:hypothetical protein